MPTINQAQGRGLIFSTQKVSASEVLKEYPASPDPMTLAESIAEEIFRTIERENRINKDDLIQAVEPCLPHSPVEVYERARLNAVVTASIKSNLDAWQEIGNQVLGKVPAGKTITCDMMKEWQAQLLKLASERGIDWRLP